MFVGWVLLAAALVSRTALRPGPPPRGDATTAIVGPGTYHRLYATRADERDVPVGAFRLDREPVTQSDFVAFVRAHPEWRRDRVAPLLVEPRYLSSWEGPDSLGPAIDPKQPVVDVSWFAARAYCGSRGMRLPTRAEWEVAAQASERRADAADDRAWKARLLDLYTRPAPARLPRVGRTGANFWGVRDLHGLVWEWVADFDASTGAEGDAQRLCAAGGAIAGDRTDFAAFEREAMRSSLRARYTTANLGFRCAADLQPPASPPADQLYDMHPALRDETGASIPIDMFRGHPLLVSMFYGSCPSACPLLISNVARIDAQLPPAVRDDTRVLLVSFDPEHDTPERLTSMASAHRLDLARWSLAVAPDEESRALADFLGIHYRKLPEGGFEHTSVIIAFDRSGAAIGRAEGPDTDIAPMVDALERAAR